MTATDAQDDWIAAVLGVDLRTKRAAVPAVAADAPAKPVARGTDALPGGGKPSGKPGGTPKAPKTPGAPPAPVEGKAKYEAQLAVIVARITAVTSDLTRGEIGRINAECVEPAKALAAATPPDYDGAMAQLARAAKRLDVVELRKRRYQAGLQVTEDSQAHLVAGEASAKTEWSGWGADPIKGVSEKIPEFQTKYIDAGKAKAAAGDYDGAMLLLDGATAPTADAHNLLGQFRDFANARGLAGQTSDGVTAAAGSLPSIVTALTAIKTATLDKGEAEARAGKFEAAVASVMAAGPRLVPLVEMSTKRSAAVTAVATVTAAPVASDKARLQTERIGAGDALVAAGNLTGAGDLFAKVPAAAAAIVAYGTQLVAAAAALAKLTDPALAADVAGLRTSNLDPAKARAVAWDHAGGAAMLGELVAKAVEIGKLAATQKTAGAANDKAQQKAEKNPAGALADVKKLFTALSGDAKAVTISAEIALVQADIDDATTALAAAKAADAKAAIARAGKGIVDARMAAERNTLYEAALATAKARVAGLPAEAAPEKATLETATLAPAIGRFGAGDREGGAKLLPAVEPACVAAERIAGLAQQYATALTAAAAAITPITNPTVGADKAQVQTGKINAATTKAAARDFEAALALLGGVASACADVQAIADASGVYAAAMTKMVDYQGKTTGNIAAAKSKGQPDRPDFAARLAELATKYITPCQAKVAGRATGPAGLPAMKEAETLATEGSDFANNLVNDTYFYVAAAARLKEAKAAVTTLKGHVARTAVDTEIAALDKQAADAEAMMAAGQLQSAVYTCEQVKAGCADATATADDAGRYAAALVIAEVRLGVCKLKVSGGLPIPPIVEAMRQAEAETVTAAKAKEATHDYADGAKLLDQVAPRCAAVEALVAAQDQFAREATTVDAALAKLTQPAVAEDVKRIRAELVDPAKASAGKAEFPPAMALLAKATAEAAKVATLAIGAAAAAGGRDAAQTALDGGDLAAAIAAVKKQLDALLAHPQAAAIKASTDQVAAALTAAGKTPAPGDAKERVKAAAELCVTAQTRADRAASYATDLADITAQLAALTAPIVATDKVAIQKDQVDAAAKLAVPKVGDFVAAGALLDTARDACAAARDIAAKEAVFQTALAAAQAALAALAAITPTLDPAIGADAQALQTGMINAAKVLAALPARDHAGAGALLAKVAPACKALALKRTMAADTPPTKVDITAIMSQPGGTAALDKVVASLPDSTKPEVLQAAIEARFGVNSFKNFTKTGGTTGPGLSGAKSLKKIYALMAQVPQGNVQNNASLKEIDLYGGSATEKANQQRGSFYAGDDKKIVLSCGRAEDTNDQPLGNVSLELPNIDPDAEMVPDSEVPAPKYFDWTTLHEVAHAIDDKTHFMVRRLGNPAFGNWQVHGSDVMPVARAIAGQCRLGGAEGYLVAYLSGAKSPPPPAPPGRADWADALKDAQGWCDAIRVGKELWGSGSGSNTRAIGGRVYHEAYGGTWVSYDLAARSKGISGYQFRAPGEWVSELYAAFHSKKLKPSHPAVAWLPTL